MKNRSQSFSRRWLIITEIIAIISFIAIAAILIQKSSSEQELYPLSQVENLITEADTLFKKQDFGDAILLYWQALIAMDQANTETYADIRLHANLRIAEIYSQSSWVKDAWSRLKNASIIDPENEQVLLLSGKLHRDLSDQQEAVNQFISVIEKNNGNSEAHYLLGVLYQGRKQYSDASRHYLQAIENDPDLKNISSEKAPIGILARLQLSRTYNKMFQGYRLIKRKLTDEDYAEMTRLESQSIILLKEANQLYPSMQEIVNDLIGLLYYRASVLKRETDTRPYNDIVDVYREIVDLDPTEVQAWQEMAEIYEGFLHDNRQALEMYKKVYSLDQHSTILAIIKSLEEDIAAEQSERK
ncbi:tetratricopeptide repeat protein [Candidatus Poribacteria bacterium]|nr:tetratricopeptide repeat protein [Candidatus Poribacteria bacterium]